MYEQKRQRVSKSTLKGGAKNCPTSTATPLGERECYNSWALVFNFYDGLIGNVSASYANLVQTREHIEDTLKIGKINDYQIFFPKVIIGQEDQQKNISLIKESRKAKKEFIQFQAMHPDISSHMVIPLAFIIYMYLLLYSSIPQPYDVSATNGIPFLWSKSERSAV